jgi:hypothetical protein
LRRSSAFSTSISSCGATRTGSPTYATPVSVESEGAKLSIGAEGFKLKDTSDELHGPTGIYIEDHLKRGETVKHEVDIERRRKFFFKKIVHLVRTSTGGRKAAEKGEEDQQDEKRMSEGGGMEGNRQDEEEAKSLPPRDAAISGLQRENP